MRDAFVAALIKEARKNKNIYLLTPDLGFSVLEEFENEFPDRFLNTGIAEANAINISAGLALCGKIVYIYSIIPFVTMRPFEQVRLNLAYMNTNVRLVGVGAGLTYGYLGASHHAIEDIAIMRSLPNMTVFCPSDPWEVQCATKESVDHNGPIYFRLAKRGEPVISNTNNQFLLGKANYIYTGNDATILFTSNASDIAIDVYNSLTSNQRKTINLISIHTIKPFDENTINKLIQSEKPIFTIEEHSLIGGLGSVVAEYIALSNKNPVFKRFSLPDEYSHYVDSHNNLRTKYGLTSKKIIECIEKLI